MVALKNENWGHIADSKPRASWDIIIIIVESNEGVVCPRLFVNPSVRYATEDPRGRSPHEINDGSSD